MLVMINNGTSTPVRLEAYVFGPDYPVGVGFFGLPSFANTVSFISAFADSFSIGTFDDSPLIFGTNNEERMRIDSDGSTKIEGNLEVSGENIRVYAADTFTGGFYVQKQGGALEFYAQPYWNRTVAEHNFYVYGDTQLGNSSSDKTTVKGDLNVSGNAGFGGLSPNSAQGIRAQGSTYGVEGVLLEGTAGAGVYGTSKEPLGYGVLAYSDVGDALKAQSTIGYSGWFEGGKGVKITNKITIGGVGTAGCIQIRDSDDAGWTHCTALNGVLSCSTGECP